MRKFWGKSHASQSEVDFPFSLDIYKCTTSRHCFLVFGSILGTNYATLDSKACNGVALRHDLHGTRELLGEWFGLIFLHTCCSIITVRNYIRVLIYIRNRKVLCWEYCFYSERTSSALFITLFFSGTPFSASHNQFKKNQPRRSSFLGRWFRWKKNPRFGFSTLLWFLAPGQRSLGEVGPIYIYIYTNIYNYIHVEHVVFICIYVYIYLYI